jgi:hypothetical protein
MTSIASGAASARTPAPAPVRTSVDPEDAAPIAPIHADAVAPVPAAAVRASVDSIDAIYASRTPTLALKVMLDDDPVDDQLQASSKYPHSLKYTADTRTDSSRMLTSQAQLSDRHLNRIAMKR